MKKFITGVLKPKNSLVALTAFGLLAILTIWSSKSFAGAVVNVYVLTGQSNSLGTCYAEVADGTDYTPGNDTADAATPFFWNNMLNATTAIGDSDGAITTLQTQQGYDTGTTYNPVFWGPRIRFCSKNVRTWQRW